MILLLLRVWHWVKSFIGMISAKQSMIQAVLFFSLVLGDQGTER